MIRDPAHWSVLAVMAPLVGALVALRGRPVALRAGLLLGALGSGGAAWSLARAVRAEGPLVYPLAGWGAPLGIELLVDGFSVVMLAVTALVGTGASYYATAYFGDLSEASVRESPAGRGARYFAPLWLLLWASLNGIFVSGDLFNLYVLLEILGLSAAAVVTLAVTSKATVAGMRYLLVSLAGSLLFLLGVALLYIAGGTLAIGTLAEAGLEGPLPLVALALMTVGLAAKTALFPLHGWLPPAHAAAPAPGSAVLSALVVKGSFFILVRLWVDLHGGGTREALLLLGFLGAGALLWGSLLALRQRSLKRLIAYSTVAQLGYLFILFPLLYPVAGGWSADAWAGGVVHALAHALAKAAMFLAAGSMTYAVARDDIRAISGIAHRLPMTFFAFGLGGLSLAGIPPSGGFVAKWLLLRAAIEQGAWGWAILMTAGGLLTLAYVLMVLRHALDRSETPPSFRPAPRRLEWAAMALALLAVALGVRATELIELLAIGSGGRLP